MFSVVYSLISFISALALLVLVLLLSLVFSGAGSVYLRTKRAFKILRDFADSRFSGRPCFYLCLAVLMSAFLFIPMGALPQFLSVGADVFVIFALLILSQILHSKGTKPSLCKSYDSSGTDTYGEAMVFSVVFLFFSCSLSWYVLNRGIPGNILSLETYSAMPLWGTMGIIGKIGFVMFFLLLSFFSQSGSSSHFDASHDELFSSLRKTLQSALTVPIFFPYRLALILGFDGVLMYFIDFSCFWLEVFIVQVFIFPIIQGKCQKVITPVPHSCRAPLCVLIVAVAFLLVAIQF